MDVIVISLVVKAVIGAVVAALASQRGRNALGWFLIGFLFDCIALILVLVLPDLNQVRAKEEREQREKERLRELLAQERMKNEAFRGHANVRLDVHDQALGLDTRAVAGKPEIAPPPAPGVLAAGLPDADWYLADAGGSAEGPLALEAVRQRIAEARAHAKSLVWHPSLKDWTTLDDSPLRGLL